MYTHNVNYRKKNNDRKKQQQEYSGSRFQGGLSSGRADGEGTYIFPNGTRYVGGFKDGMFEGAGTMYIPNCGAYTAQWSEGKKVDGDYKFSDGLEYKADEWEYCTMGDRRFKTELENGIKPAGQSQMTDNSAGDSKLEANQADAGDGYVDLRNGDGQVRDFQTGEPIRYVEASEKKWLMEKCRIGPNGTIGKDVGALLKSIFVKADPDGGNLSKLELMDLLKEADYKLIRTDTSYNDPEAVMKKLEIGDSDALISYDAWLELWRSTA